MTIESLDWKPIAAALGLTGWVGWQYVVPLVKGEKKPEGPKSDDLPPLVVAEWVALVEAKFPHATPEVVMGWLATRKTLFEMALDYAWSGSSLPNKGDVK